MPDTPQIRHAVAALPRLRLLREGGLLEPEAFEGFDRIARIAQRVVDAPIVLVTMVDLHRQVFVGQVGLEAPSWAVRGTPLSHSFCQHVVAHNGTVTVPDVETDPMFAASPAVEDLGIAAYLGVPVRAPGGEVLGALCAIDTVPRTWTEADREALIDLAALANSEVAARLTARWSVRAVQGARDRLRDHRALVEVTFHQSPVPTALVDLEQGTVELANRAFGATLGVTVAEVLGLGLDGFADDAEAEAAALQEAAQHTLGAYESRHRTADGVREVRVETQRVDVDGRPHLLLHVEDLTARRRAETRLSEREALLRLAVDAAGLGLWSTDLATGETYWDDASRALFGVGPDAPVSAKLGQSLVHPDDQASAAAAYAAALDDPAGRYRSEKRVVHPDGAVRWLLNVGQIVRDAAGEPSQILGLSMDVTERKRAEAALADQRRTLERLVAERTTALQERSAQVRQLAAALTLAEQRERRRLAHVLHEDLQQILYGASLHLSATNGDAEPRALVAKALDLTRSLAHTLAIPGPPDGRLDRALVWLGDTFGQTYGLEIEVDTHAEIEVAHDVCDAAVLFARELLFNVLKHADVSRATLRGRRAGDWAVIEVADEGIGFDADEAMERSEEGLGLRGITERAALIGARVDVASAPGQGTCVTIRLPRDVRRLLTAGDRSES